MERQQDLEEIRSEVFILLGKTIVNLQSVERMLKTIVGRTEIRGDIETAAKVFQSNFTRVESLTMGKLINELITFSLTTEEDGGSEIQTSNPREFAFRSRIIMDEATFKDIKRGFSQLVRKRNALSHKFTTLFDLQTKQGCLSAINYLNNFIPLIRDHHTFLGELVKVRRQSTEALLLELSNSFEQSENATEPTPNGPEKGAHTASSS